MTKFEGSSSITSKITTFLGKVPTTIFVNPGLRPFKSVKIEKGITSSKINIFQWNLDRKCILPLPIDLTDFSRFPNFSRENDILGDFEQVFQSGNTALNLCYIGLESNTFYLPFLRKSEGYIDFSSLDVKDLILPVIFT